MLLGVFFSLLYDYNLWRLMACPNTGLCGSPTMWNTEAALRLVRQPHSQMSTLIARMSITDRLYLICIYSVVLLCLYLNSLLSSLRISLSIIVGSQRWLRYYTTFIKYNTIIYTSHDAWPPTSAIFLLRVQYTSDWNRQVDWFYIVIWRMSKMWFSTFKDFEETDPRTIW